MTDGALPASLASDQRPRRRWSYWPLRSLVSKLAVLLLVFLAVPVILYNEFRRADQDKQALLVESVREHGRLMAESLRPLLEREDPSPLLALPEEVKRLATPTTGVKVLFRPKEQTGAAGFFMVASRAGGPAGGARAGARRPDRARGPGQSRQHLRRRADRAPARQRDRRGGAADLDHAGRD